MRLSLSLILVSLALTTACHRTRPPEGPAEKAGRAVDDAAARTRDAAKDAAPDTKKAVDDH